MKKCLIILLAFMLLGHITRGTTIRVGKGQAVATIREAHQLAKDGDTLWVYPGTYKEKNITISKKLTLLGKDYPVLDGEHTYEIISVKSPEVVIRGFKLIHSGVSSIVDIAAIKIYNTHHVYIVDNIFYDTFFGIYSQSSSNCTFENNRLTGIAVTEQASGNGIHCWKSDSLKIIANTVTGHRDGIYLEFVTNSVIWRNTSYNNMRYGLHFMFSDNDAYISNIFRNNGAGVSVMFTHKVKMFNNIFEENWGDASYGIFLKEISDSHISGNKFLHNTSGIFMEGTNRILVEKIYLQGMDGH